MPLQQLSTAGLTKGFVYIRVTQRPQRNTTNDELPEDSSVSFLKHLFCFDSPDVEKLRGGVLALDGVPVDFKVPMKRIEDISCRA